MEVLSSSPNEEKILWLIGSLRFKFSLHYLFVKLCVIIKICDFTAAIAVFACHNEYGAAHKGCVGV